MGGSIGTSWSSGLSGQDHYNDQLSWRQTSNADGTASFTQTALNQVWGSATTTWASQGWGSLSGAGSGNVWNLGGSSSSVYGLAVSWVGFSGSAAFLLGPGGSGPSAFGIKIGLPTGGGGPLQYLQYMGMGWWEANSFGTFSAGTPPSQWARGGLIAGHEVALGQGVGEVPVRGRGHRRRRPDLADGHRGVYRRAGGGGGGGRRLARGGGDRLGGRPARPRLLPRHVLEHPGARQPGAGEPSAGVRENG